ncbi:MAG: hypothetical protein GQ533_02570 [Methanosarcinaceae archaeon]|nr:hypothetical protein [Methanosarcinaceae archaeon]
MFTENRVGWQALLWSLVDEWVSGGPGVRNGSCVCSLPAAVKIYNIRNVYGCPPTPGTAARQGGRWQPTL